MRVGEIDIAPLHDGTAYFRPTEAFVGTTDEQWEPHRAPLTADGRVEVEPGSTVVVVSSGDRRALRLGDVVHCPVELVDDEWAALGDVDPALAKRTRNALARELEGTDVPAAASHFPEMRFGRLLAADGRRR